MHVGIEPKVRRIVPLNKLSSSQRSSRFTRSHIPMGNSPENSLLDRSRFSSRFRPPIHEGIEPESQKRIKPSKILPCIDSHSRVKDFLIGSSPESSFWLILKLSSRIRLPIQAGISPLKLFPHKDRKTSISLNIDRHT
jgi:hypothetical protein